MLSGNDVEVDDGDYHQRTALHLAASSGHIAMVRHLVLIHGANMNVLDRSAAPISCLTCLVVPCLALTAKCTAHICLELCCSSSAR